MPACAGRSLSHFIESHESNARAQAAIKLNRACTTHLKTLLYLFAILGELVGRIVRFVAAQNQGFVGRLLLHLVCRGSGALASTRSASVLLADHHQLRHMLAKSSLAELGTAPSARHRPAVCVDHCDTTGALRCSKAPQRSRRGAAEARGRRRYETKCRLSDRIILQVAERQQFAIAAYATSR